MKKNAWSIQRINKLTELAKASSNKSRIFCDTAKQMGLKPNTVRNFYYKHANASGKKTFKKFTKLEIQVFLREIILGYSRGESIRGICLRFAGGVRSKMLRYQNKYRSVLENDRGTIKQIVKDLEGEGYLVKDPLGTAGTAHKNQGTGGGLVLQPDNVIAMPQMPDYNNLSDQDITNLFMGVVRLVRKQAGSQIEKLKAEIERLKSASTKRRQSSTH